MDGQGVIGTAVLPDAGSSAAATGGRKFASLQVLRFLAASAVIVLHAVANIAPGHKPGLIDYWAPAGVDVFFVLSGFLIGRSLRGATPREFLVKRLTRILPLYYLVTLAWVAVIAAAGHFTTEPLLASALLIPTLAPSLYLTAAWTLGFELLFYLAATATLLKPRAGLAVVLALYAAAMIAGALWSNPLLAFVGSPLTLEFLAGAALTRAPSGSRALTAGAGLAMVISAAMVLRLHYVGSADGWRPLLYGPFAVGLVYLALQLDLKNGVWRRLAYLGDASYSAYLIHQLPLLAFVALWARLPLWASAAGMFALSWCLAPPLYELVERRAIRVLRRAAGAA